MGKTIIFGEIASASRVKNFHPSDMRVTHNKSDMAKNTKMLIIISIYATATLFFALWAMYNVELISGLAIFITHFALLGFALQGIENNIKSKSE